RRKARQANATKEITANGIADLNCLAHAPQLVHRIALVAIPPLRLWKICRNRSDNGLDLFCGFAKLPSIPFHHQCDAIASTAFGTNPCPSSFPVVPAPAILAAAQMG